MGIDKQILKMTNPLVSIIVPSYKQAHFLNDSLQSVLNQTYSNWECIIVNDGSPDNTSQIAAHWCGTDSRFIYLEKQNGGISSARNAGLDIVKGSYVQFLDADDYLHPEKLNKSLFKIKDHLEQNIIVSHFKMFKDDIHDELTSFCELSQENLCFNEMLYGWGFRFNIPIHCGFFSASLFDDFRFIDGLKANEDWIMWLTFFQKKLTAIFIDEILAFYRNHSTSATKDFDVMLEHTIIALSFLDQVISKEDYKSYLLFNIKKRTSDCEIMALKIESLGERVITSNKSIGYRMEKKIRNFFKRR